ncbi:MAG: fibronectin type III domain-containing protein, partial [Planctomycetota bacterium]
MMKLSFVLVLCITGIASAVGEPVCLVINPTDAGVNDQVTLSAYDASDNWVDMRDYGIEICFDTNLCIFTGGGGLDVSSGNAVFTLTQAILDGYKFDCGLGSTWFTLVNPHEGDPAFTSIAEAIAAGGDCTLPADTTAPTPDPMTWATAPYGYTATSIRMVATTASDQSGVEYRFEETSGNPGGSDSGWQDSETYTDTGLSPSTQYCYRVQARDKSDNENAGGWSTPDACSETADGETLYNGIVLPQAWPPEYGPVQYEPMPVPYLDDPPEVVLIDVGRQLFVDD